jgi:anti-sigma B factor antagonist
MRLDERSEGNVLVVGVLTPRVDAQNAEDLRTSLGGRIDEGRAHVILNLARVEFMDSAGLGCIVSLLKRLGGRGTLSVCCLTETVDRVFKLTRLNKAVNVYGSEDEAIRSVP